MAEGKNGDGRMVRLTVRISVPEVSMEDVVVLERLVAGLVHDLEGATYDLNIGFPRPERPR